MDVPKASASVFRSALRPVWQWLGQTLSACRHPARRGGGVALGAHRMKLSSWTNFRGRRSCRGGQRGVHASLPNFARACGRVPVGGHPDKRPDSRQGLEDGWRGWTSLKSRLPVSARRLFPDTDRQPEAKPANPESPRGTQLKATTERAFLVSPAFHRPAPKRLVLHCRPCGVFPNRTVFRVRTDRPL